MRSRGGEEGAWGSGGEAEARGFGDEGLQGARKWSHLGNLGPVRTRGHYDCIYQDGGDLSREQVSEENPEFLFDLSLRRLGDIQVESPGGTSAPGGPLSLYP